MQTLYPTRSRRGLINVIGTGFKYLFGVLDEEDREKIINYLHTVTSNNKNMINTINSQIEINEDINNNLKTLQNHIINETKHLYDIIDTQNQNINSLKIVIENIQYNNLLDHLENIIEQIQDNIANAKNRQMARFMLNTYEIQKYNITLEKSQDIKLSVLAKNKQIVFVVAIPIYTTEIFKVYEAYGTPNDASYEVTLETNQFVKINDKMYPFKTNILSKYKQPHECLTSIIENSKIKCNKLFNKDFTIEELEKGQLLIKNANNVSINQNCNEHEYILNGQYVINFDNCNVQISNKIYKNTNDKVQQIIPRPLYNNIKNLEIIYPENEMHLKHIKKSQRNKRD